eukprot:121899-Pleurochrysis_carterae.AAC.2
MQTPAEARMPRANANTAPAAAQSVQELTAAPSDSKADEFCIDLVLSHSQTTCLTDAPCFPAFTGVAEHHVTKVLLDQKLIIDYGFEVSRNLYIDNDSYDALPRSVQAILTLGSRMARGCA